MVEEIELSVRTKGCLLRAGLRTIGDVVQKSPQELLKINYFGTKSLREIVCILADMGLELRQENE